ncbi:gluzincin family metallopeptidase [Wolbachia endosymbiont of Pentidionis agamae]|uniref:carboxypeptidase n=1 Tax=Wolbachia endosymbiont of Pentidionis agamae TaxID=3110435 RepID=UPI002FCFA7A7
MKSYKFLQQVFGRIRIIDNTLVTLSKSQLNVNDKVEQIDLMQDMKYEIISHDLVKESLSDVLSKKENLNDWQLKNIQLINKIYEEINILPIDLVKALSKARIEGKELWNLAYYDNNFKNLINPLSNVISLVREVASIKSKNFGYSMYDAVLEDYDSSIKEEDINDVCAIVGKFFHENNYLITEKQNKSTDTKGIFHSINTALNNTVLRRIKIKKTERVSDYHCFSSCSTQFISNLNLSDLLYSSGSIIYKKGLQKKWINQPIGDVSGYVMYETQGLLMEKIIGKSMEFCEYIQPIVFKHSDISVNDLYCELNKINQSVLLKESDEFTSLAHIMIRYALEKEIIYNKLQVTDLRDAWMEGMKYYNISTKNIKDNEAYFQDHYWISGILGYFPLKLIAGIAAVQIFNFIKNNYSNAINNISKGNFDLLIKLLSENIYSHGAKYNSLELLKRMTNKENLDIECYTNYLLQKYTQ